MLRSAEYAKTEEALSNDPVVIEMASDLRRSGAPKSDFAHDDGGPRHAFMIAANDRYFERGGSWDGPLHLGAIGRVAIRLAFPEDA